MCSVSWNLLTPLASAESLRGEVGGGEEESRQEEEEEEHRRGKQKSPSEIRGRKDEEKQGRLTAACELKQSEDLTAKRVYIQFLRGAFVLYLLHASVNITQVSLCVCKDQGH